MKKTVKKLRAIFIISVLVVLQIIPSYVYASSSVGQKSDMIYEEFESFEEIIELSKSGYDELAERTGISLQIEADDSQEIEVYHTSRLVSSERICGENIELYEISTLGVSGTISYDQSDSGSGCSLYSKMFLLCKYENNVQKIKLLRTTAKVTGSASSLRMVNAVRRSAVDRVYYSDRPITVNNPTSGSTYVLYADINQSSVWIDDSTGIASLEHTVTPSSGRAFSIRFSVNPVFMQSSY